MKLLICCFLVLTLSGCFSNVTEPEEVIPLSSQNELGVSSSFTMSSSSMSGVDSNLNQGFIIDLRDSSKYNITNIGSQWWMAENLNFGEMEFTDTDSLNEVGVDYIQKPGGKLCYNDNPQNCETNGGLYQWHIAMNFEVECGNGEKFCYEKIQTPFHRGICPEGWHIPTKEDWDELASYLGGDELAGMKMKISNSENSDWNDGYSNNGNSSGFSVMPVGYYAGFSFYYGRGDYTYFWEAREDGKANAYTRGLFSFSKELDKEAIMKDYGISVRCILDFVE